MTIKTTIGLIGTDGVLPQFVFINTTDNLAKVITPGYLNSQLSLGYQFTNEQIAFITCSDATVALEVSVEGGNVNLLPFSTGEVTSVFARSGNVIAQTGDYTTSQVTESGNLYFTEPRVRSTALTGLSITNSAITAADSVLSAFGKTQGQINAIVGSEVTSVFGRTGAVVANTGDYTAAQVTNAADKSSLSMQIFLGQIEATNGILITEMGGGLQFDNTGAMTNDSGLSFFESDLYYRIGFDNNGTGLVGWLRSNVDLADTAHGFIWSAGTIGDPINAFMYLRADGKLMLSPSADTASFQSLSNIYGDLFLGNIVTPSTPTGGGKLYSKLVSGDSNLFYLDSAGTDHQLTNASAGLVTSVFGRTGAVVSAVGDYSQSQITGLKTSDSPSFTNLTLSGGQINSIASIQATSSAGNVSLNAASSVNIAATLGINLTAGSAINLTGSGIHLNSNTIAFNGVTIDDSALLITSSGNPFFELKWDDVNLGMVQDSMNGVGGSSPLWMNPTGGKTGFGFTAGTTIQSMISCSADIFFNNIATPSTPTGGGKFYSKNVASVSTPYFLDSAGVDHNLINNSNSLNIVSVSSATYTNTGLEDELVVDANGIAIGITIDTTLLTKELRIYKTNAVSGSLGITITPSGGQTINGSSSSITIANTDARYSYIRILPSDSSTAAFLADISVSVPLALGSDSRPSGIKYKWGFTNVALPIPPTGSAQYTVTWAGTFNTLFNVFLSVAESTTTLPMCYKIIAQSPSGCIVEIFNASGTLTTAPLVISAFAVGI